MFGVVMVGAFRAVALVVCAGAGRAGATMKPMLFMDLADIAPSPAPYGKLQPKAQSLRLLPDLNLPARINWTDGATTFAAFEV